MNKFWKIFRKRNLMAVVSASMIFTLTAGAFETSVMAAPVYNDVPSGHWAHASISAVADRGLIVGDSSGNFKPDDQLNKFDTSKILAKAAGYKYDNLSQAEQDYYNECYNKNKSLLLQYSAKFKRWNTTADREIAFLLEKKILVPSDLNQFSIISEGVEKLRALSRGELAVFLVRLLDENADIKVAGYAVTDSMKFNDDASISSVYRNYIYYAKSLGIFTGDTNGNFNYNSAVTRAAMATTLDKALGLTKPITTTETSAGSVSAVNTVVGTFDQYYPNLNAIQIIVTGTNKKEVYALTSTININIDGNVKTINDLTQGMTVVCVTNNKKVETVMAQSSGTVSTTNSPSQTASNAQISTIEGTVSSATASADTRTIGIEIKMLNPRDGSIVSDIRAYTLASDCKVYRSDEQVSFSDIAQGDIVTAEVSGSMVYKVLLEQKSVVIKDGTLLEKQYNDSTGVATLVISDSKGKIYNLRVTSSSTIARQNTTGTLTWEQLRVGDTVDVTAEYGSLVSIMAFGIISTVDGWIDELNIGRTFSYVNVRDSAGNVNKYYLIKSGSDPYSLRVGSKVRLRLDSKEISTVMLLEEALTSTVTGTITNVKSKVITLNNTQPYGTKGTREIYLDSNTIYMNSKTGERVYYGALSTGQRVYVVCKNALSDEAVSVTILTD